MGQPIKGILFDVGDTLLDFGKLNVGRLFRASAEVAYKYLKSLSQPLPPFTAYYLRQLWAIRWRYFVSRATRREFNSLDLMIRLGKRMGHALTHEQSLELSWRWYSPLAEQAIVEPGTAEMLRTFRQDGLKLGLVSNTFIPGEVLDRHLRQEGLLEMLDPRIYSCQTIWRKPDRRIFELALERAGLSAEHTLFVGDSPGADIRGANRAGLISVLKDPADKYAASRIRPAHRIRSLTELPQIVADKHAASRIRPAHRIRSLMELPQIVADYNTGQ